MNIGFNLIVGYVGMQFTADLAAGGQCVHFIDRAERQQDGTTGQLSGTGLGQSQPHTVGNSCSIGDSSNTPLSRSRLGAPRSCAAGYEA
jgi:hypothetical protein